MTLWNKQDGLVLNHTAAAREKEELRQMAVSTAKKAATAAPLKRKKEATRAGPETAQEKGNFPVGRPTPARLAWPGPPRPPFPAGFIM